jgi:hypothetical protein
MEEGNCLLNFFINANFINISKDFTIEPENLLKEEYKYIFIIFYYSFNQIILQPLFTQKIFFYIKLNQENNVFQSEKLIFVNLKKICNKTSENFLSFISTLQGENNHTAKVNYKLLIF